MLMFEKIKYHLGISPTYPVFIIGTGRSGTHWLGYSLKAHPQIKATIECHPMFGLSKAIALNPELENVLIKQLVSLYRLQLLNSSPRLYLDKSHPNIWIAEKLKHAFPKAKFIGIERNVYATVASMLKEKSVLAWHEKWRNYPVPNRFLGITQELSYVYDNMPMASKCTLRWLVHRRQMNELRERLGKDIFIISYENFAMNTSEVINHLRHFLKLNQPIKVPEVKKESMNKWQTQLTTIEIDQIRDTIEKFSEA